MLLLLLTRVAFGDELTESDIAQLSDVELRSLAYLVDRELDRRQGNPPAPAAPAPTGRQVTVGAGGCVGAQRAKTTVDVGLASRKVWVSVIRELRAEAEPENFRVWLGDTQLDVHALTQPTQYKDDGWNSEAGWAWVAKVEASFPDDVPTAVAFPLDVLVTNAQSANDQCELRCDTSGVCRVAR